jgi:hypothetical protein
MPMVRGRPRLKYKYPRGTTALEQRMLAVSEKNASTTKAAAASKKSNGKRVSPPAVEPQAPPKELKRKKLTSAETVSASMDRLGETMTYNVVDAALAKLPKFFAMFNFRNGATYKIKKIVGGSKEQARIFLSLSEDEYEQSCPGWDNA